MKGLLLAAVLSLTACSGGSQPATHSLSTASNLSCRVPVTAPTTSTDAVPGGWITFPGAQFNRDSASLAGRLDAHLPSYDRKIGRWVPVESKNVAPDGASYILHGDTSLQQPRSFYLVDARTGARQLIAAPDGPPAAPGSWDVVQYASAGVYLWSVGMLTVSGLWLLDPQTGAVRVVEGSHYWRMIGGGSAWALDPPFGGSPGSTYTVYRLDLASGRVSTWYQTKTPMSLLSPTADGEVLIVYGEIPSAQVGLIAAPEQLVSLSPLPGLYVGMEAYLANPGVWIPLPQGGLALYTKTDGVRVMSQGPAITSVAGDCE